MKNEINDNPEIKRSNKELALQVKGPGRPSTYTEEAINEICERISNGETLRNICREKDMPSFKTVYRWKGENKEFSTRFARAREEGFEAIAEECLEIADDGTNDYMTITKGNQQYNVEDREVTNRSKLRVETRLKLLAKWYPQKYGDKIDVTTDGGNTQGVSPELLRELKEAINKNAKK